MGIIRTFIVSAWGHQYKEYKNSPMDFFLFCCCCCRSQRDSSSFGPITYRFDMYRINTNRLPPSPAAAANREEQIYQTLTNDCTTNRSILLTDEPSVFCQPEDRQTAVFMYETSIEQCRILWDQVKKKIRRAHKIFPTLYPWPVGRLLNDVTRHHHFQYRLTTHNKKGERVEILQLDSKSRSHGTCIFYYESNWRVDDDGLVVVVITRKRASTFSQRHNNLLRPSPPNPI